MHFEHFVHFLIYLGLDYVQHAKLAKGFKKKKFAFLFDDVIIIKSSDSLRTFPAVNLIDGSNRHDLEWSILNER